MNEFQSNLLLEKIYIKNLDINFTSWKNQSLKILSWNIERGFHPDQIAAAIQSVNPDIAALQEVDWGNERTEHKDVLEIIAHKTNMRGYFGIEFFEIDTPFRSRRMAGGGVHGNAILTKIEPESVYRIELPRVMDWETPPPGGEKFSNIEKRIGARFALCADFLLGPTNLTVCSTHFEDKLGGVKGRIHQLTHLIEQLDNRTPKEGGIVVAGDLNTLDNWLTRLIGMTTKGDSHGKPSQIPECGWWKSRVLPETGFQDPFACKDWTVKLGFLYHQKLDWILVKHAEIRDQGIGALTYSDHKHLWVEIAL